MKSPALTSRRAPGRGPWLFLAALMAAALSGGCDLTGAEAAAKLAEQREADGKAVGSACRHAGRAIEDCYALNGKAQRAAVFAGWREMDEYMRDNKLEPVPPSVARGSARSSAGAEPELAKGEAPAGEPRPSKKAKAESS